MFSKIKEMFAEAFSDEITINSTITVRELAELTMKKDWRIIQTIEEDTTNHGYDYNMKVSFYVPIEDLKELCKKVKRDICEQGDLPHDD